MLEGWGGAHTEAALVGVTVGVAAWLIPRWVQRESDPAGLGAVLIALGLVVLDHAPLTVFVAVVAVVATTQLRHRWWVAGLAVGWIGMSLPASTPTSLEVFVPLVLLAGAGTLAVGSSAVAPSRVLALTAITGLGVFVAVPDTEEIVLVATAVLVIGLAALRGHVELAARSPTIALPAVLVLWAGGVGARGRPVAFVGVTASFGLLWLVSRWPRWCRSWPLVTLAGVQGVLVVAASRGAGIQHSASRAWLYALPVLVAIAGVGVVGQWLPRDPAPRRAASV